MHEGKPPSARPFPKSFDKQSEARLEMIVWFATLTIGMVFGAFIVMVGIVDKQGNLFSGGVAVKSLGAVIMLLLITTLIPNKGKDGKW